ncbi:MAG: DUF294 nucleotidyltransferase-like domain-containing protein [Gammaproteobacteria bacterium]|nr:DUF294 nucleotidyltransferase-like domain-containing protein [Gammaproteobacteria bacterium]
MEIEQLEIHDYLGQCPPLDKLTDKQLDALVNQIEISYVRRGVELLKLGEINSFVYLIRSGAMSVYDADGQLQGEFAESSWLGYRSVLRGGLVTMPIRALEDSLLYAIPAELFRQLVNDYDFVKQFFSKQKTERLRTATRDSRSRYGNALVATSVRELIHGEPLMVEESATIRQVAQAMTAAGYTIALVMKQGLLTGIVTDRAYCTKVAARDLSLDASVVEIMTKNPITIPVTSRGSDALLIMARHNIRHLPVFEQQQLVGVVTATDLIREQSHNAIYLINEIHRAKDENELKLLSRQLPDSLMVLVSNSLTAYDIGHAISSIGRAITQRLLHFAEHRLGAAPVGYAWIVAGSMARNEQTAVSDQDNALILSDDYDEAEHGEYFEKLSRIVCDGLNHCGYIYCPGDVMATNKQWRQPLAVWLGYFSQWIDQPEPMALMYASIFFDLRCVHGDQALLEKVQAMVLQKTRSNSIFLGHMANNALKYQPPLGLFRNFVLEKTGREEKALNLKKRGTVPVIDLARVYALSAGLPQINTQDRLEAACAAGVLSREGMEDLIDTFEFVSSVRLKHQAAQVQQGEETDNYVSPEKLTSLDRRHLKDAFDVVRTIQSVMEQRYKV